MSEGVKASIAFHFYQGFLNPNIFRRKTYLLKYSFKAINATHLATVNFTLNYKWHKCGNILTGTSHVIRAPKNITYPVRCAWKVKYPNIDDEILISFEKMNLASCDKSYIQIR